MKTKERKFTKHTQKLLTASCIIEINLLWTHKDIYLSCDVTKQIMPKNIHSENTRAGSCLHKSFVLFVADQWDR
jgi:hypothetical protein